MKRYKVYYYYTTSENSPTRYSHINIEAVDKWQAIAKVQSLYGTYHYLTIIQKVERCYDSGYWVYKDLISKQKDYYGYYVCNNCGYMTAEPTIRCSQCGAYMSIYKEV